MDSVTADLGCRIIWWVEEEDTRFGDRAGIQYKAMRRLVNGHIFYASLSWLLR